MKKNLFNIIVFLILINLVISPYPVVVFHGINDNCNFTERIISYLSRRLSLQLKCIEIGNGNETSMWTSINTQGKEACEKIRNDPTFANKDISVIGISQGGLIGRYIIQKCSFGGSVKRFISFSTPEMGVAGVKFSNCGILCNILDRLIGKFVYFRLVQDHIAPASYFKDRFNYNNYLEYSSFLADINNERTDKNPTYKEKIMNLEKVLLVVNEDDEIVDPPTSGWFDFYRENTDEVIKRRESAFYLEDYIGIRKLEEENKITFAKFKGKHVHYTIGEIEEFFVPILQ